MDKKLTLPDLVADISSRTGIPKLKVEEFLKEFIALASETLEAGESVRIKGIGTFKVSEVEARRSVHVATGETIEIPAHHKVAFSASSELADAVNEPFAFFEAVELADGVSEEMLAEAAENPFESAIEKEIATEYDFPETELNPEEGARAAEEFVEDFEEEVRSEKAKEAAKPAEVIVDVPFEFAGDDAGYDTEDDGGDDGGEKPNDEPAENKTPATTPATEKPVTEELANEEPVTEKKTADPYYEAVEEKFAEPAAKTHGKAARSGFNAGFVIGILGATCTIFLALAIWRAVGPESYSRLVGIVPQNTETGVEEPQQEYTETDDSLELQSEIADNEVETIEPDTEISDAARLAQIEAEKKAAEAKRKEDARLEAEKKAKEKAEKKNKSAKVEKEKADSPVYDTISRTRYLTTMAKEHYGNYHLWPYIYEENKAILGHPDRIRPGTKVVIPPLSKYGVNPKNPADIAEAKRKGAAIYSRYK